MIAYRTGLDVDDPPADYCERVFQLWRDDGFTETRAHAKPIRDRLLRRTLEVAKRHDRPVHIHCGGGDPAIVLGHARPQDLFPLLAEHADQPVVLIHSGLALARGGRVRRFGPARTSTSRSRSRCRGRRLAIDQKLEVLLGAAPPAKILYGSDEASEPEVIWLSAQLGREALGRVLGTAVERTWLTRPEARADRRRCPRRQRAPAARDRGLSVPGARHVPGTCLARQGSLARSMGRAMVPAYPNAC